MQLIKPLQSSAVRFLRFSENSEAFGPDVVAGVKDRYQFWEIPRSLRDLDIQNGITFNLGRFQTSTIKTFQLYQNGVLAQGDLSTDVLDLFLDDLLQWATTTFSFVYKPLGPVEKIFVSSLEVSASDEFSQRFGGFSATAEKLSGMIAGYGINAAPFSVSGVTFDTDDSKPVAAGRFIFERRANQPFASNVFYSSAPVSTAQHLELLADLETSL